MKKKITSFFAMALMFAGFANAQVAEELQGNKIVSFGDQVASFTEVTEGNWYALYQARGGGGLLWDQNKTEDPGNVSKVQGVDVIGESTPASQVAEYMVRFVSTDQEGIYKIQFGTGRYIMNLENENNNSQRLRATESEYDAAKLGVYNIVTTDENGEETVNDFKFGINFIKSDGSYGLLVDNNDFSGGVATVVTWNSGKRTSIEGNSVWEIYALTVDEIDDFTAAKLEATAVFNEYLEHVGTFEGLTEPNTPGHYSAEAVAAFEAAMEEAALMDGPGSDDWTAEQFKALAEKIKSTYQAVIDSKVPYAVDVEEGYYLIQTSPFFYTTTEETTDPETGEVIPGETVYMSKGLRGAVSGGNVFAAWDTYDAAADDRAIFLWKVTKKGDKKYQLRNMGYDVNTTYWTSSGNLYLNDVDSTVVFDYNPFVEADEETGAEIKYYNIRPSNTPERDYYYVHAGGHSNGAGVNGWIVKWSASEGAASEWKLVSVSEEDAQAMIAAFAPIKDAEGRLNNAEAMLADVENKMLIAEDNSVELSEEPLITDVAQLSSPYTETPDREPGSGLEMLIDGNVDTYWHSSWASEVAGGTHYLQVELTNPADVTEVAYEMTRRHQAANDHPTVVSVYGTNDSAAEKDACTLLGTVKTPFGSASETVVSQVVPTQGFTFLRFYADEMAGANYGTRGYWHAAEFQLYAAKTIINETSQAIAMGEVFTNLQAAVAKAKPEVEAEEPAISVETYNELKAAYDAFIAMYVNPDTLRNKVADMEGVENYIVLDTDAPGQPGLWKDNATVAGVTKAVAEAQAYDAAGKYTLAESQAHIAAMDAAKAAMLAAANPVQEGKWYQFQFASEELYDENGWDKDGASANVNSEDVVVWPALFSRYVAAGKTEATDGANEVITADETPAGTGLYYMDEIQFSGMEDVSYFRFISVGDSAYIIQNKATGLFLYGTGGAYTLQPAATTFKASAMGFGKVMVTGHNADGSYVQHLHAQRNGNSLVSWGAEGVATNTGFMVYEAEDVDAAYDGSVFQISMAPNSMASFCYPTEITATEGDLYGVYIEGTEVTLTKLENKTAKAGQPFIYINGDTNAYDAEAEKELVSFTHGNDIVAYPDTTTKHVGTFYGTTVAKANVLVNANGIEVAKSANNNVKSFSSYIKAELDPEAVLNVTVSDEVYDSIQEVVSQAVKGGNIYTIDGKFVGKGNLSTKLSRGTYIINGVKVIVK